MNDEITIQREDLMQTGPGGMYRSPLVVAPSPMNAVWAAQIAAWRPGVLPRRPDDHDDDQDEPIAGAGAD